MKPAKPIKKPAAPGRADLPEEIVTVVAAPGKVQPIFYKGSIIHIGENQPVEINVKALAYQSRGQFERALKEGDIIKVEESK